MTTLSFDAGAEAYDGLIGRWSQLYVAALAEPLAIAEADRILDVACGTGAVALALPAMSATARLHAADISVPMLAALRARAGDRTITIAATDALALPYRSATFDVVLCQLGLMHIPDPALALGEMRRVLGPHGRIGIGVWARASRVPPLGHLVDALDPHLDPPERHAFAQAFAYGEAPVLTALLETAGFHRVKVETHRRVTVFDSFEEYWRPIEAGAGRVGQAYRALSGNARAAVRAEVARRLGAERDSALTLVADALLATASVTEAG